MLPDNWTIKTINDIARVTSGGTPARNKKIYWGGNIPWITTTEVQNYKINKSNIREYITEHGLSKSSAKFLPENTILMAMIGQGKTRGQVALLTFAATCNQNCAAIICNNDNNPVYYFNYLLSQYKKIRMFSNTAGKSNLTGALVKSMKVPVPPIAEQNKISEILSCWDKAIEISQKLLSNSQRQKKALLQQLLTGSKRFPGHNEEFKRYHFPDVATIDAKNISNKTSEDYEFKYISLSDVNTGEISEYLETYNLKHAHSRARRVLSRGDVLLATVRPNLQSFAKVSKLHENCIASTGFSVLMPKKRFCGDYLFHYLFSAHITGQINALVAGSNYPAISSSDVAGLSIYCPGYLEQKKIALMLNISETLIQTNKQKLTHFIQEKKALMQQLLTGKCRVNIKNADNNTKADLLSNEYR